ncbi:MAG: SufE family protein [Candidatus Cardinium sp.]|uniref:SufE family protein n=1 Tax=Cardinium endosymbiont of Dermatophagoides farinae TaxID=2597823 RepID=UPI0011831C73|nr:SufE family protein [Cardinium endosymbiont of Dermatophagoides farinae]TSJ80674.1 SufE family protein [Cardinium endosymbiont of Dermatophagoides farinae]UWW96666.1 MAG: SufE family protein [Candidatus Cardinium sp.]
MVQIGFKTVDQHQDEIIDAFATLSDDRVAMLDYLIDLGNTLVPMDPFYKTADYLVQGCMSKVWVAHTCIEERLFFQADSNTAITKGLIALLLKVLSGQSVQAIIAADLYFIEAIGIRSLIGFQRASGLAHMIKTLKLRGLSTFSSSNASIMPNYGLV